MPEFELTTEQRMITEASLRQAEDANMMENRMGYLGKYLSTKMNMAELAFSILYQTNRRQKSRKY